jgi:hypothetical protein
MLQLQKDAMQARSEPPTAPHFVCGDNVTVATKNRFLRGLANMKLRDRQLGPFTVAKQIGKHNYRLGLPSTIRLHPVFHFNNLRPRSIASLQFAVREIALEAYDEEFDVVHISTMCIKSLHVRRRKYLLFMTHFTDDEHFVTDLTKSIVQWLYKISWRSPNSTGQIFQDSRIP